MIAEVLDGWSEDDVRRYIDLTERFVADGSGRPAECVSAGSFRLVRVGFAQEHRGL